MEPSQLETTPCLRLPVAGCLSYSRYQMIKTLKNLPILPVSPGRCTATSSAATSC